MNLAYYYPIIFWNAANLIVDSGAEFSSEPDDEVEDEVEDEEDDDKTNSTANYGKIASAIGKMQARGIRVLPPNVNTSNYTYTPNVKNNTILYGLKGIVKVGDGVIDDIIKKRPFKSLDDFLERVDANKTQIINLIKSGALDDFGEREVIMEHYIRAISGAKNKLTLQNAGALIEHGLFPEELDFEVRVFNFNKYLRKFKDKNSGLILLDEIALNFYSKYFDEDLLSYDSEGAAHINSNTWKALYDVQMGHLRTYLKAHHDEMLEALNRDLTAEAREKYAKGDRNKWSMDSVCFYQDTHELEFADLETYGVQRFADLPEEPVIAYSFPAKDGHMVHMYKLTKIAGTVIDKKKEKSQITLLTTDGVITVQAYGVMPQYDKQISEVGSDGKKHVVERSWFTRGNKIIINGMRRGENIFVAKKYQSQPGHHFALITAVNDDGSLELQEERIEVISK